MALFVNEIDRKNKLLDKFRQDKDEHSLMDECFLWSLESQVWQDIDLLEYPNPPQEWVEYENMNPLQKSKVGAEYFHQGAIKEYLQAKSRVYASNYGHWSWLKDMKAFYPKDDEHILLHQRLDEKLQYFNAWFGKSTIEEEKLKKIFGGKKA